MKNIIIFNPTYSDAAEYFFKNNFNKTDEVYFAKLSYSEEDRANDVGNLKKVLEDQGIDIDDCEFHLIFSLQHVGPIVLFASDGKYNNVKGLNKFVEDNKDRFYLDIVHEDNAKIDEDSQNNRRESILGQTTAFKPENIQFHRRAPNFLKKFAQSFQSLPVDLLDKSIAPVNVKKYFSTKDLSSAVDLKNRLDELYNDRDLRLNERHEVLAEILQTDDWATLNLAFEHPFFSRHHDDAKTREAIRDNVSKLFGKDQHKVWITESQKEIKAKLKELLPKDEKGKSPEKRK